MVSNKGNEYEKNKEQGIYDYQQIFTDDFSSGADRRALHQG